ncbi:MAG: Smr/MutS family protein [Deltaproteobacteria bacterium]|nr:Smr/MutS family protein [Deltaproteobacteria bacterium]MBW2284561.1 Smr/MutS family protein [Deltaproteobacteria bacterium]
MPRKKKRKPASKNSPAKTRTAFNPAFNALKSLKKIGISAPNPPPATEPAEKTREVDETHEFLQAMAGVEPLRSGKQIVARTPNADARPAHPAPDDELEAMAHLSDLVAGQAEMDISFSDEYIEGAVPGFSRKLMKRLKGGEFPTQDHIDLHGLTKQEAEHQVREFLHESYQLGRRCVLVVHGRGLNSENHIPVLKERLPRWLSRGPIKKIVLAFSTARPYDGGTGAIYVLLRKHRAGAVSLAALRKGPRGQRGH